MYTVPGAAPVLFQSYVLLVPYACTSCHVPEDAGRIQNSKKALEVQPVALAVTVTCVPLFCTTLAGDGVIVTAVQGVWARNSGATEDPWDTYTTVTYVIS